MEDSGRSSVEIANQMTDSVRIATFLRSRGLVIKRLEASPHDYFAAVADSGSPSSAVLEILRVTPEAVVQVAQAQELAQYIPTSIRWFSVGEAPASALAYSQDYRAEIMAQTTVLCLRDREFQVVFRDLVDACRPAELRDLDLDQVPELVEHVEHPAGRLSDCISNCDLELMTEFSLTLSWTRVRKWDGTGWRIAEELFPEFYADLADRYAKAATWARESSEYWSCEKDGARFLDGWAERARALAEGNNIRP